MRVQQKLHESSVFQSFSAETGAIISPVMWAVPARQPIQWAGRAGTAGGPTSATGFPKRVTRMGLCVLRTRSRIARQVALKVEMAICSITYLYHDHRP